MTRHKLYLGDSRDFDNLNPILWHKISNAKFEANTSSSFLGKPYEPIRYNKFRKLKSG